MQPWWTLFFTWNPSPFAWKAKEEKKNLTEKEASVRANSHVKNGFIGLFCSAPKSLGKKKHESQPNKGRIPHILLRMKSSFNPQ